MIARRQCEGLAYTSRFFTDRGVRPRFSLRSNHDERAMAMVRAGLGVTVAPRSFGGEGIAIVSIDEFGLRRNIGLVYSTEWDKLYSRNHLLIRALRLAA
jgi:DNA-binding transcriptional LysR family regulator